MQQQEKPLAAWQVLLEKLLGQPGERQRAAEELCVSMLALGYRRDAATGKFTQKITEQFVIQRIEEELL